MQVPSLYSRKVTADEGDIMERKLARKRKVDMVEESGGVQKRSEEKTNKHNPIGVKQTSYSCKI